MTSLLLFALTACQEQVPLKILGHEVKVEFPTGGPFDSSSPSIDSDGFKIEIKPDGSLGKRYKVDGGWADARALYESTKTQADRRKYRVKVFVIENSLIIDRRGPDGTSQRRGQITDDDGLVIAKSLATFKGLVEGAAGGRLDVQFDAETDGDIVVDEVDSSVDHSWVPSANLRINAVAGAGSAPFGQKYVLDEIAPRFNSERFDTDDGVYRGPFDAVFVIHAGLCGGETVLAGSTTVSTVPYFAAQDDPARGLPVQLFEAWRAQLAVKAGAPGAPNLMARYPSRLSSLESAWAGGQQFGDPLPWQQPKAGLVTVDADWAEFAVAELAKSGKTLRQTGWTGVGDSLAWVVEGVTQQDVDSIPHEVPGVVQPPKSRPGEAAGNFEAHATTGPEGAPAWEAVQSGAVARGYAVVWTNPTPLNALTLSLKIPTDENQALALCRFGEPVRIVVLSGRARTHLTQKEKSLYVNQPVAADDQWHPLSVQSEAPFDEIRVVSPFAGQIERVTRKPAKFSLSQFQPGVAVEALAQTGKESQVGQLARTGTSLSPTDAADVLAALQSQDSTVKLTALDVLSRAKLPEATAVLSDLSQSLQTSIALLSAQALAFQDTPEAWAQLRLLVDKGTFDHNKRFGAEQIVKKPDPAMAASLNYLASRSWHTRLAGGTALGALGSESASVLLGALFRIEPAPQARAAMARVADVRTDLAARNLMYAAVNDPSERVRAACLVKLIDCPDKQIQAEALKGVRDEAVGVRIALLESIRDRKNDAHRPALRLAVTDLSPSVRAAALLAFATQPGPVDPNEVKNTFTDPDPAVKKALADLAKAKGFQVPGQ